MTRAPRSRKKKSIVANEPALAAVAEAAAATAESLSLPLPAPEEAIEAGAPEQPPETSSDASDVPSSEEVMAVAEHFLMGAEQPSTLPAERSSMRIEVTEDRTHLGQRLRAARDARGWSREDVAHRLHVPTTVVADIEAERFERLGAPIYVRGYLSKYAQLVELPMVVVNRAIEGMAEPVLKASTDAPRVVATWERYRVAVIGGVITLAVAIPVLTLVANRGINSPVPLVRSLDESDLVQPPIREGANPAAPSGVADVVAGSGFEASSDPVAMAPVVPPIESAEVEETEAGNAPLMASMAGFTAPAAEGGHVLEAQFREDSWIEIFDADGRVIEQNLVRAGQSRRYQSTGAVSIKIGNVGGVDVRADGNPIDLAPHARANVARLRLFEEAAATPTP